MAEVERSNLAFIDTWVETYNSRDIERYVALHADNAEVVMMSRGARYQGREQLLGASRAMLEAFPDRSISVERWVATGDLVAIEGIFSGTLSGTFAPRPDLRPGEVVAVPVAVFLTLRDSKIVSDHTYA